MEKTMTTTGSMESDGFEYDIVRIPPPANHFQNVLILAKAAKKKREVEANLRERLGRCRTYIPQERKKALSSLISKSYIPRCDR